MITILPQKKPRFICEPCDFKTGNKKDYTRHILTSKHTEICKMVTNDNFLPILPQNYPNITQIKQKNTKFACKCGNIYTYNSGLSRHKKLCKNIEENNNTTEISPVSELNTNENLVQYLLKENSDFKNLIMELVKKEYMNNTNNINNTTNNVNSNNSFNLNVFLNDTCKGAMNMSEFVNTIAIQMSDLENFAHMDYANGVSKILLKNLNNLETNQRPIHCTDLKRETVYIKENDCWTKETDEKQNLKKAIKQIAFKNIKHINEWVKENPGCQDPRTKQNVKYNKIVMNSMSGGTIEEQEDNIEKIVKNVTKAVTIDKYSLK
jgi:predicted DNA binding protein